MIKKSQAVFLNRKELFAFEKLYQALKSYPGFRMENIFNYQTREHYSIKIQCANLLHKELHKNNPRLNVAIHEAGHAIVMTATYAEVGEAVISVNDNGGFIGHVASPGYTGELDYEPIETSALPPKSVIHSDILTDAAGFVAEEVFTTFHSNAYHEKFLTFVQSRYLDEINHNDLYHHWNFFMHWCKRILLNNEALLHAIAEELLKFEQIAKDSIDLLHSKVKREQPHPSL